ncbi:MAG: stage II sporulation protein M [Planctomycetaceae bacterium]
MTRDEFVKHRQDDWDRFEALLSFAEGKRTPRWNGDDISEFSALFRAISYDLSLVRSRDFGLSLNRYLNNLVARGHSTFYRGQPGSFRKAVRLFTDEFPWLLRKNIAYFWVALALFVLPGLIAGMLLATNPELGTRLFSEQQLAQYDEMHNGTTQHGQTPLFMTSFYIQHNIGIAFKCFASGVLLGIGTVCHLVYNSIALGGITGFMVAQGNSKPFFTFVISHGSFELTAIVVAGAAGLMMGRAIVHPGSLTRYESIKTRGLTAVKIALGAGGMLAMAAVIEGFWSPSPAPSTAKFIVGTFLWLLVFAYLAFAGRGFEPDTEAETGAVIDAT